MRVLINKSNQANQSPNQESLASALLPAPRSQSFSWVSSKQPHLGFPPAAGLPNRLHSREGPPAQRKSNKFLIKQPMEKQDEHLFCCNETPVFFRTRKPPLTDHPKGGCPGTRRPRGIFHRLFQSGNLRRLLHSSLCSCRSSAKTILAQSIINAILGPCSMKAIL